ncbi:MAG: helix-turn-helix domain-containing protein [Marinilabiliaceae bacterium]|nr:helix-turn-helix domain-containing protein [Marinilabiliaceae bacterium]
MIPKKLLFYILFTIAFLTIGGYASMAAVATPQSENLFHQAERLEVNIQSIQSGLFSPAMGFDGVESSIELQDVAFASQLSFSAWIKPANLLRKNQAIMGIPGKFWLRTTTQRELQFTQPGVVDHNTQGLLLTNDNWIFVTLVIDLPEVKVYYNSELAGHFIWNGDDSLQHQKLYIGKDNWRENFQGPMYGIQLFDKPLTEEQIRRQYFLVRDKLSLYTGLIFYHPFEESGTFRVDETTMTEQHSLVQLEDSVRGKVGGFNGSTSYIDFGTVPIDNASTIATWIKPETVGGVRRAIAALGHAYAFRLSGEAGLEFTIPQKVDIYEPAHKLKANSWQHLAVSFKEGAGLTFYLHGERIYSYATEEYQNAEKTLKVGTNLWNDFFHGQMDDLLIWNRILSPDEVKEVYAMTGQQWRNDLNLANNNTLIYIVFALIVFLSLIGGLHFYRLRRSVTGAAIVQVDVALHNINATVDANLTDSAFTLEHFAQAMHMSKTKLYNELKEKTGHSPKEYIRERRLEKAACLLKESDMPILAVAFETGFESRAFFNKCFKRKFGETPTEYRKKELCKV